MTAIINLPPIEFRGIFACWTRAEEKVNRGSYPVPTPPAIRGMFERIYREDGVSYRAKCVYLLNEPRYETIKTNGIKDFPKRGHKNNSIQRLSRVVKDPHFIVEAEMHIDLERIKKTNKKVDQKRRCEEIFLRNLKKKQPRKGYLYFGRMCYPARYYIAPEKFQTVSWSCDLGTMVHNYDYLENDVRIAHFFSATVENGVMEIPLNVV